MKRKTNILFIGLGSIGQRHLRNLNKILSNNASFYAYRKTRHVPLLDKKGNKVKGTIEKKYNISLISNLGSVNENNIDIVFVTNPSSLHINSVLKLKNLKNAYIFIEKPIDSSLKNYKKFLKYLTRNKNKIFVGHNMRFHPGYIKLKNILKNRKILNKIHYAIFKCSKNLKDYHSYEDYKISYAARKELGGGVCLTAVHEIDMMIDLFGNASKINSHADKLSMLKLNVEDFSLSFYKNYFFKNKVISLLILDFIQLTEERYIKIIGNNGEIFLDLTNYFLKVVKKNSIKTFNFKKNRNLMYLNQLKLFLNYYRKKEKIPDFYNEQNALKSLKLALEIKKNFKLRQK